MQEDETIAAARLRTREAIHVYHRPFQCMFFPTASLANINDFYLRDTKSTLIHFQNAYVYTCQITHT